MSNFVVSENQIDCVEIKGLLAEVEDVSAKMRLNAGIDRLYKMQEELGYIQMLIDRVNTKLDKLLDEKQEDEEYY